MEPRPSDFSVPIYLNQRIVFDLLAMMEDGFSEFRDETSSSSATDTRAHSVEAGISGSNLLQIIGLAFKGGARRDTGKEDTIADQVAQRRFHTPASLFYKLRSRLNDPGNPLIKSIRSLEDVEQLSSGEFVEFKALLRKNPLVALLETFRTWAGIGLQLEALDSGQADQAEGLQDQAEGLQTEDQIAAAFFNSLMESTPTVGDPHQPDVPPEQQLAEQHPVYRMIKLFEAALTEHGSLEIIGELLDAPSATAVLSTRFESFEGGDATEIIDGEFRVLGKVVRVVSSEDSGSINLLRKTAFGAIKEEQINDLAELLTKREESQEDIPIELPEIQTRIEGPAILVLPTAIFV